MRTYADMHNLLHNPSMKKRITSELVSDLRAYMVATGLSQVELSVRTGVHQSQISRILSGVCRRADGNLLKLCNYANIETVEANADLENFPELLDTLRTVLSGDKRKANQLAKVIKSLAPLLG